MITVAELRNIISADVNPLKAGAAEAQTVLNNLGASGNVAVGQITSAFAGVNVAALAMSAVVVAAVAAIGKAAFDAAVEYDAASDKIRAATGATGAELQKLENTFRDVFTSIPTSATNAAQAISFLSARLHETGPNLEDLAKSELELARITGSALGPQLETTTRLFKDWEIATGTQTNALDFLFKVGQKTSVTVTELSKSLVQFGAPLRELGFSFEQAAVLVGKFQSEGVVLEKVLPGLRIALSQMAKEGINDATQAFELLIKRIQDAPTPMEAVRLSIEAFGRRAGPDLAEAIKQGRFSIEELMKTVQASQETIRGAAKDTDDFAEKWTILKNKVTDALEPLGKVVFDALTAIVSTFIDKSDEIERRWTLLWKDLVDGTREGQDGILTQIFNAEEPFSEAGHRLADAIHDGFFEGLKQLGIDFGVASRQLEHVAASPGLSGGPLGTTAIPDTVLKSWRDAADAASKYGFAVEDVKKKSAGAISTHTGHAAAVHKVSEAFDLARKSSEFFTQEAVNNLEELARAFQFAVPPTIQFVDAFQDIEDAQRRVADAAKDLVPAIRDDLDIMGAAHEVFGNIEPFVRQSGAIQVLQSQYEQLSQRLPSTWGKIVDAIVKGSGQATAASLEFGKKIAGVLGDVSQVIGNFPGKVGDSLRKAANEFDKWFNTIDGIVKLVQRILGESPDGLGGILSKVSGIFKKTTQDVQDATTVLTHTEDDWAQATANAGSVASDAMQKTAKSVQESSGQIEAAIGVAASAFSAFMTGHAIGGVKGAIIGGIEGAMTGFQFGGIIGAAIGGVAGILGGIFGGGKSAQQKQTEALQLEQLKQQVQESAQNVINAAIDGFNKALEFFNNLDEFTAPRKAKFQEFWKAMTRLMNGFLELAKTWAGTSLDQAKQVAEAIGPIAEAISALPNAFAAINGHFGVAQAAIDQFFNDFSIVMEAFFARSEVWIDGVSKRAMKVANRLAPVVSLITAFGESLKSISGVSAPNEAFFQTMETVLNSVIAHITAIADKVDKAALKAGANLADKGGTILEFVGSVAGVLKSITETPIINESDMDRFLAATASILDKTITALGTIVTEGLQKASAIATSAMPIISLLSNIGAAIKSAVDASSQSIPDFSQLKTLVAGAIQAIIDIAQSFDQDAVSAAGLFSDSANKVMGFLSSVGSTLKSLNDTFATAFDFGFVKAAARGMIELVIALAQEMGTDGVTAASGFATASQAVVGFMSNVANAFKTLKEAGEVTVGMVEGLVSGFGLFVTKLSLLARDLGPEAINSAVAFAQQLNILLSAVGAMASALNSFATASNSVLTFMTNIATAFESLKNVGTVTVEMIDDVVNRFGLFVTKLGLMAESLGPDAIDSAVKLSNQFGILLSNVGGMVATLTDISLAKWPTAAAWDGFVSSIELMVNALQRSLSFMTQGQSLASQLRQAASEIASSVTAMTGSLAAASGIPGAGATASSFGALSLGSALAPATATSSGRSMGTMAAASAGPTIVVQVQGSLIHESRVEDAVMRALVRLDRTGRRIS